MIIDYCLLPLTDPRFAYVSSHNTDISETIRRFTPPIQTYASEQVETEQIPGHHEGADYWMNQGA